MHWTESDDIPLRTRINITNYDLYNLQNAAHRYPELVVGETNKNLGTAISTLRIWNGSVWWTMDETNYFHRVETPHLITTKEQIYRDALAAIQGLHREYPWVGGWHRLDALLKCSNSASFSRLGPFVGPLRLKE